jgi:ribosomal-protein-alanine acetyltransferase
MAGNCRLRPASPADLAALAALERRAFDDPWSEAQLRTALDWRGALAFVADHRGEVAGYVLGRVVVDEGEILSIAIAPDRRREGIGRELLDTMIEAMIRHGAHSAWLEVRESNRAARAMYAIAGFVATGVRPGYYRHPEEDALILRRDLLADASDRPAVR